MFDNKDNLIKLLRSPLSLQSSVLQELQSRLSGNRVVSDPNSPACFLMEFGSSVSSAVITAIEEKLPQLYPKRAQTMEDLFHHMSDYDYVGLYGTPAQAVIRFVLPKQYAITSAKDYNENYKRIVIPKNSKFFIGTYQFGMYHPINIDINKHTSTFTVTYDTDKENPLHSVTKNIIDKFESEYQGIKYIMLDIPVYQFSRDVVTDSLVKQTGYVKKIRYNDRFYAVRIFNFIPTDTSGNGTYTELKQTLSNVIYDTSNPTAILQVLPEDQSFRITIPQIYFDKGLMGSKLIIEVHTTRGALDVSISNTSDLAISADFALSDKREVTEFSSILKQFPFTSVIPGSSKIIGGSNGIDFSNLRDMVVNNTFYDTVPITERDIEKKLAQDNFYVEKYKDNVTSRIFYCYKVLTDNQKAIIPSTTVPIRVSMSQTKDVPTMIHQLDDSITILPTTLYRFNENTLDATALTTSELSQISALDKEDLAELLNTTHHLRSPFHIRLTTDDRYPKAVSYNLMNPEILKTIFVRENPSIAAMMSSGTAVISHLDSGVGGYNLDVYVSKSEDVVPVPEEYIKMYGFFKTSDGKMIGKLFAYKEDVGAAALYRLSIPTTYCLTEDNDIEIRGFKNPTQASASDYLIPLESNLYIVYMVHKDHLPSGSEQASSDITSGVPEEYLSDHIALARQYVTIKFGENLSSVVNNRVEIDRTPRKYATWAVDVPKVYTEDVFERDLTGNLVYPLVVKHSAGDPVLDEFSNPEYLHRKGDVRYSVDGTPIVDTSRERVFFVDAMFIDAKMFASEHADQMNFVENLTKNITVYLSIIKNLNSQLKERNFAYFRPVRSIGTGKFDIGDDVVSVNPLEMEFRIRCYVHAFVMQDDLVRSQITSLMTSLIETAIKDKTISMMDIFNQVKKQMSDYILHIDLLGINGNTELQTMIVIDKDAQPSIARKLIVTEDQLLILQKQIHIEFLKLDPR